jgi:hypothetical protein
MVNAQRILMQRDMQRLKTVGNAEDGLLYSEKVLIHGNYSGYLKGLNSFLFLCVKA